jgi:HK97 family phage prohead protease
MSDDEAMETFPDQDQRFAFCQAQWENENKAKAMKATKHSHYSVKPCGSIQAAIKDVDTETRTVTGFFNTFHFLDSDRDVLLPGAAKKSIKERGPKSQAVAKIKHAMDHDLTRLPGKIVTLEEREIDGIKGIYFETRMADTTLGNDTLKNYLEKIYDNHSIGFQYLQMEMVERDAKGWDKLVGQLINPEEAEKVNIMWAVKEIALFEGSTVAFGANQLTPFLGVKSGNKEALKLALFDRMEKLTKALRNGTQSDETMETFELQVLQMKQMLDEIVEGVELVPKPITTTTIIKPEEQQKNDTLITDSLLKNLF